MKGFLWGSLALIILEVIVKPAAADKVGTASNILVAGLRRLSDPKYGGVPNYAKGPRPSLIGTTPTMVKSIGRTGPNIPSVL